MSTDAEDNEPKRRWYEVLGPGLEAGDDAALGQLLVDPALELGLGLLGVILPGLPTTPFVLLAAACYARASPRLYAWLLANPVFGPLICDWRAYGAVPRRAKWLAILTMAVTVGLSVWMLAGRPWLQAMVVIIVGIVALWLWRRPEPPVLL